AFIDEVSLELGEDLKHAEHCPSDRIGIVGVESLRHANESNAGGRKSFESDNAVSQASAPTVELPNDHHINPSRRSIFHELVSFRSRRFGAGDRVDVFPRDLPAADLAISPKLINL